MWVILGLFSAVFLGIYDVCKKHAVKDNAVLPVLFLSLVFGAIMVLPTIILSPVCPEFMQSIDLYVPPINAKTHFLIAVKSSIITIAWILAYSSLKHLPISIAAPIKALGPVFTLIGAIFYFHESLNQMQWLGLLIIIVSFFWFSSIGRKEQIVFRNNKWIYFAFLATIATSISGLYDKQLIAKLNLHPQTVQSWFAIYLLLLQGVVISAVWLPFRKKTTPFKWRWSIPAVGVLLIIADFIYFRALTYALASIVILSAVKRTRVIVTLVVGGIVFKEQNKRKKLYALLGILVGVFFILFSGT